MIRSATDFGALIRQKRKARGWTQAILAEKAGTGERFVIELEAGKPGCQLEKALTVARTLGIALIDAADPAQTLPQADDTTLDFLPVLGKGRG